MKIDAIIFDKDGVIVDFEATFAPATRLVLDQITGGDDRILSRAARSIGFDPDTCRIEDTSVVIAGTSRDIARELSSVLPIEDVDQYGDYLDNLYGEACSKTVQSLPGVAETLEHLSGEGFSIGLGTNDAERNARLQLQKLGVDHRFDQIFGADSGHGAKPGPGMINAFCDAVSSSRKSVMMVGDSIHDMEAGRNAGVVCVAVETGPASAEQLKPHADYVLPSISGLPGLLGSI